MNSRIDNTADNTPSELETEISHPDHPDTQEKPHDPSFENSV